MRPLFRAVILSTLSLFILSACQTTKIERTSDITIPDSFNEDKAAKGSSEISHWWAQWQDPLLSDLIEQGLLNNYDIKIAESRLNESLAVSRFATADLGPSVNVGGSLGVGTTNSQLDVDNGGNNIFSANSRFLEQDVNVDGGAASVGFIAAWEPDIFGKKRSDADAAYFAALGKQEKVYGAQMMVTNQIGQHYIKARAIEKRQSIANRNIAVLKRYQRYVQNRFEAGQATAYEINNIKSKLNAVRAQKSTLDAEYNAQARSIAVLIGQVPQNFTLAKSKTDIFSHLPDAPSGQTPAGLLERRPDIRAREKLINVYSSKLASAEADLLPRFTINFLGMGGRLELDSDVPDLENWSSILNIGLQVPLFTNGRIQANIDSADARLQTALLEYDQNILQALSEVDNAYQAHQALQQQNKLLNKSYRQARKRANDAEKLFRYGHHTLDNALDAELDSQELHAKVVDSELAKAEMLLDLYMALGGGWLSSY